MLRCRRNTVPGSIVSWRAPASSRCWVEEGVFDAAVIASRLTDLLRCVGLKPVKDEVEEFGVRLVEKVRRCGSQRDNQPVCHSQKRNEFRIPVQGKAA